MDGNASKQYVDYLELVEARTSSKNAMDKAKTSINLNIISIGIAVVALGITILAMAFTGYYSNKEFNKPDPIIPKPPYEVKIIENNPKVQKLEKEVKDLSNELHEAEMLISSFESK